MTLDMGDSERHEPAAEAGEDGETFTSRRIAALLHGRIGEVDEGLLFDPTVIASERRLTRTVMSAQGSPNGELRRVTQDLEVAVDLEHNGSSDTVVDVFEEIISVIEEIPDYARDELSEALAEWEEDDPPTIAESLSTSYSVNINTGQVAISRNINFYFNGVVVLSYDRVPEDQADMGVELANADEDERKLFALLESAFTDIEEEAVSTTTARQEEPAMQDICRILKTMGFTLPDES